MLVLSAVQILRKKREDQFLSICRKKSIAASCRYYLPQSLEISFFLSLNLYHDSMAVTIRVRIGILWAAIAVAASATSSDTPLNS